mmetsp:Transcript_50477/g.120356  ORF Transcript_50477/g.120356 Transcript_50477/m.120356 type:complete len:211 (-) Transcript_50477:42-674(-)
MVARISSSFFSSRSCTEPFFDLLVMLVFVGLATRFCSRFGIISEFAKEALEFATSSSSSSPMLPLPSACGLTSRTRAMPAGAPTASFCISAPGIRLTSVSGSMGGGLDGATAFCRNRSGRERGSEGKPCLSFLASQLGILSATFLGDSSFSEGVFRELVREMDRSLSKLGSLSSRCMNDAPAPARKSSFASRSSSPFMPIFSPFFCFRYS